MQKELFELPLKNTTGLEYKPLIKNKAWRKRRQKIIERTGRAITRGVQAQCHSTYRNKKP